jgi:uncharacterized membrane protein YjfL (UPF0719 family)
MADREKARLQRLWDELRPHFMWQMIKLVFVGGGLTFGYALLRSAANETVSLSWAALIFVISCVGYAGISLYLRSQRDRLHGKSTGMFTAVIVYLPMVLGLGFCVWAYHWFDPLSS